MAVCLQGMCNVLSMKMLPISRPLCGVLTSSGYLSLVTWHTLGMILTMVLLTSCKLYWSERNVSPEAKCLRVTAKLRLLLKGLLKDF